MRNSKDRSRKRNVIFLCLAVVLAFFVLCDTAGAETGVKKAQEGLYEAAHTGYLGTAGNTELTESQWKLISIPTTIGKIIGALLSFVGVVFLVLMIYGGFTWMMARGNEQEVTKAKSLIEAAIIGLVIVLAAYAITGFISGQLI